MFPSWFKQSSLSLNCVYIKLDLAREHILKNGLAAFITTKKEEGKEPIKLPPPLKTNNKTKKNIHAPGSSP